MTASSRERNAARLLALQRAVERYGWLNLAIIALLAFAVLVNGVRLAVGFFAADAEHGGLPDWLNETLVILLALLSALVVSGGLAVVVVVNERRSDRFLGLLIPVYAVPAVIVMSVAQLAVIFKEPLKVVLKPENLLSPERAPHTMFSFSLAVLIDLMVVGLARCYAVEHPAARTLASRPEKRRVAVSILRLAGELVWRKLARALGEDERAFRELPQVEKGSPSPPPDAARLQGADASSERDRAKRRQRRTRRPSAGEGVDWKQRDDGRRECLRCLKFTTPTDRSAVQSMNGHLASCSGEALSGADDELAKELAA